ncbi:HTH domain-containing protein [Streptococcus danieliae]|uniref:HTH domain-containing protein n=1 Tax=Streptococcus danieliae TaxID=747656 RepID=A0A7X3G8X9_9STRE|nr:HTH domain-containing protein [Streptococcus danieliae]MVX59180.1 HTH domain-containing protein [Streptococcus danieliae]
MTDLEVRLLRLIPVGSERPINGKEIAKLLGIGERTVRDIISRLIVRYGVPIVANRGINSGHYIPANDSERLEGIRELNSQYQAEGKRLGTLISADLKQHEKILAELERKEQDHESIEP